MVFPLTVLLHIGCFLFLTLFYLNSRDCSLWKSQEISCFSYTHTTPQPCPCQSHFFLFRCLILILTETLASYLHDCMHWDHALWSADYVVNEQTYVQGSLKTDQWVYIAKLYLAIGLDIYCGCTEWPGWVWSAQPDVLSLLCGVLHVLWVHTGFLLGCLICRYFLIKLDVLNCPRIGN